MALAKNRQVDGTLPEFTSTHPSSEGRMENLRRLVPKAMERRRGCVCAELKCSDDSLACDLSECRWMVKQIRKEVARQEARNKVRVVDHTGEEKKIEDIVTFTQ